MTMAARYSEEEFMAELRRCDFDFGRLSNEIAARDAGLPASELVASLRAEVMQHWTPPGGGWHGALNHVVIHGLDVTVPLGVPRRSPDATIRVVLDDLTGGGVHERFGTSIQGRSLQATDLDWSYGSGPALRGPAEDLALVLCGRAIPQGRLEGRAAVAGWPRRGPLAGTDPGWSSALGDGGTAVDEPSSCSCRRGGRRAQQAHRHTRHTCDRMWRVIDRGARNQRGQEERRPVSDRNRRREDAGRSPVAPAETRWTRAERGQRGRHRQRGHAVEAGMSGPALVEDV